MNRSQKKMRYLSVHQALNILKKSGCNQDIIQHSKSTADLAVEIALKCVENDVDVDVELVRIGALLHDLGRSRTQGINHPVVGAKLARSYNMPEPLVQIIERHLGGGINRKEAENLGWPESTYMPQTIEEKIVTYADKRIKGNKIVTIEESLKELGEKLGQNHQSLKRIWLLHEEILQACGET